MRPVLKKLLILLAICIGILIFMQQTDEQVDGFYAPAPPQTSGDLCAGGPDKQNGYTAYTTFDMSKRNNQPLTDNELLSLPEYGCGKVISVTQQNRSSMRAAELKKPQPVCKTGYILSEDKQCSSTTIKSSNKEEAICFKCIKDTSRNLIGKANTPIGGVNVGGADQMNNNTRILTGAGAGAGAGAGTGAGAAAGAVRGGAGANLGGTTPATGAGVGAGVIGGGLPGLSMV